MHAVLIAAAVLLAFDAYGPQDGEPVILLHGFPDTGDSWRHVVPLIEQDYRVIVPDLRGYGDSPTPEQGYDLEDLAADVIALADHLELSEFHLVGHDWGAAISWWVAIHHPDRLRTLTVLDVGHPVAWEAFWAASAEQRRVRRPFRAFVVPGAAGYLAKLVEKDPARLWRGNLVRDEAVTDADLERYAADFATADDWRGPLAYYKQLYRPLSARLERILDLPRVQVPTLVLWGRQDAFVLADAAPLSCGWVDARCETTVFEDAAHWGQWDVPEAVVARWREFLAKE